MGLMAGVIMSIKGNVGQALVDLAAFGNDTVILDFADRVAVSALSIHNTTAASREIYFFESTDQTSANGERIAVHTLAGEASVDVGEIIGQGYSSTQNIIAVVQTTGALGDVNAKLSYTQYTGTS